MNPLDAADGIADPGRDGGPRPLGGVSQAPAPAAQPRGVGQLPDERIAFRRQPDRPLDVVVPVGPGQLTSC